MPDARGDRQHDARRARCGASARAASRICCGLTASTTSRRTATASRRGRRARDTPNSPARRSRASAQRLDDRDVARRAQPFAREPAASAVAMLPPPMKVIMSRPCLVSSRVIVRTRRSASPEDRGADPHHRRAFRDRRLEVVRHAHRQRVERRARRAQGVAAARAGARSGALRAPCRSSARGSPSARAAAAAAAAPLRAPALGASPAATPLLVASPLTLTCMQHLERRAGRRALRRREPLGDLQPVDRRAPSRSARATARVLLLCSGPMKCQSTSAGRRALLDLGERLLHVVLAEVALTGGMRLADVVGGKGLGDGDQRTMSRGSRPAARARRGDARLHGLQAAFDRGHNRFTGIALSAARSFGSRTLPTQDAKYNGHLRAARLRRSRTRPPTCTSPPGLPPMIRVHGDVRRINLPPLEHKDVHAMMYDIMNDAPAQDVRGDARVRLLVRRFPSLARFRVNAFNQQRGAGGGVPDHSVQGAVARGAERAEDLRRDRATSRAASCS